MPYPAGKSRVSFVELCAGLARHGFQITHMGSVREGEKLRLNLVVMNEGNLACRVSGPVGPPYWGEDLFYRLLGQVCAFGEMAGR